MITFCGHEYIAWTLSRQRLTKRICKQNIISTHPRDKCTSSNDFTVAVYDNLYSCEWMFFCQRFSQGCVLGQRWGTQMKRSSSALISGDHGQSPDVWPWFELTPPRLRLSFGLLYLGLVLPPQRSRCEVTVTALWEFKLRHTAQPDMVTVRPPWSYAIKTPLELGVNSGSLVCVPCL